MAIAKKHGKGRLDKWYKLAKQKGYRARAAFKLIQLNRKYSFLEGSKVLIDLCAAPGSWCQVAAETMPPNSLIVGVDIAPIKAIPRVVTVQSDITTEHCRSVLRHHLKTWKADTVIHDGAPNVGTAWVQDAYSQAELTLQALKLALEFLSLGGNFVTKVFRSSDYNSLLWVFNQIFEHVDATKPPSSRTVSAEIFVVCRGLRSHQQIDSRFLDPRSVFAELKSAPPSQNLDVSRPEAKIRKRQGYEEGQVTLYKEVPVMNFIWATDPITILASTNKLVFHGSDSKDLALKTLERIDETSPEIRELCEDLKVLGRKEFKQLLKWRRKIRDKLQANSDPVEDAELQQKSQRMDASLVPDRISEDTPKSLYQIESSRRRKEDRKIKERHHKELKRLQMGMSVPADIISKQVELFDSNAIHQKNRLSTVWDNRMGQSVTEDDESSSSASSVGSSSASFSDEKDIEDLDQELEAIHDQHHARRDKIAKFGLPLGSTHNLESYTWSGLTDDSPVYGRLDSIDDGRSTPKKAGITGITDLSPIKSAARLESLSYFNSLGGNYFDQGIFNIIPALRSMQHDQRQPKSSYSYQNRILSDTTGGGISRTEAQQTEKKPESTDNVSDQPLRTDVTNKLLLRPPKNHLKSPLRLYGKREEPLPPNLILGDLSRKINPPQSSGKFDYEAVRLAQKIKSRVSSKKEIIDDSFNKFSFENDTALPAWFIEEEGKYRRPYLSSTMDSKTTSVEKKHPINARTIKKALEAKARKRKKALKRIEYAKTNSALIAEDDSRSERDKAEAISRLMKSATRKTSRKQIKVFVTKGGNKRLDSRRPSGIKGKYKVVDSRLKKDSRALKRLKLR